MQQLLAHPASALVTLVIVALAARIVTRFVRGVPLVQKEGASAAFFGGVLLVNALAHFTHGISGEQFAAPFGYLFSPGILTNISNVVWGFINLVLGYTLTASGMAFGADRWRTRVFFAGVLAMGLFLTFVFTK